MGFRSFKLKKLIVMAAFSISLGGLNLQIKAMEGSKKDIIDKINVTNENVKNSDDDKTEQLEFNNSKLEDKLNKLSEFVGKVKYEVDCFYQENFLMCNNISKLAKVKEENKKQALDLFNNIRTNSDEFNNSVLDKIKDLTQAFAELFAELEINDQISFENNDKFLESIKEKTRKEVIKFLRKVIINLENVINKYKNYEETKEYKEAKDKKLLKYSYTKQCFSIAKSYISEIENHVTYLKEDSDKKFKNLIECSNTKMVDVCEDILNGSNVLANIYSQMCDLFSLFIVVLEDLKQNKLEKV